MGKDKVVNINKDEALTAEQVKKALCTVTVLFGEVGERVYEGVAGYQLVDGNLVVLVHEGPTYLMPMRGVYEVCIEANKE